MAVDSAWLIVALPFLAGFLIIGSFLFGGLKIGDKRIFKTCAMLTSIGAVLWGFFHSITIFEALRINPALAYQQNWDWFSCQNFKLSVGFLVDNLACMMLIVVTTISLFVQVYTHGYMREDPGYARFYAYLSLFTGSMLGLVVSTNMFQMYGFWELVGVCSYFLIGFWWYKNTAAAACMKAFVVNRIGDFAFLVGILMLLLATKDFWSGGTCMAFVAQPGTGGTDLQGALQHALQAGTLRPELALAATSMPLMAILIFGGPIAKSAQFPLHVWLPDAMEGPTPISALIHAATMVAAGIYLVARAYPIFLSPDGGTDSIALAVVATVGTITAVMAATIALSQNDIKRVLAWSTCSQLGYMMAALGVGAFSAGLFHLFTHAFFKAMLFLGSGAVILGCHHEQDIRKMGGLAKVMPWTGATFLIGTLAIAGVPPLSAWFSKDEIVAAAMHYNPGIGWALIITAGLTAFYMFRLYFLVFTGSYRGEHKAHEVSPVMWLPLVFLAVPSIFAGGLLGFNNDAFFGAGGVNPWASFIHFQHPHVEKIDSTVMGISTVVALLGIGVSIMTYVTKTFDFNKKLVESNSVLWRISYNKWYFDEMYFGLLNQVILPLFNNVWKFVDTVIIDNIVNGASLITSALGEVLKYTQTGRGQYYALVIFMWVALLTWIVYMASPFA
jgi:proton-translocating NADH-quinone oxidoreductase chain L